MRQECSHTWWWLRWRCAPRWNTSPRRRISLAIWWNFSEAVMNAFYCLQNRDLHIATSTYQSPDMLCPISASALQRPSAGRTWSRRWLCPRLPANHRLLQSCTYPQRQRKRINAQNIIINVFSSPVLVCPVRCRRGWTCRECIARWSVNSEWSEWWRRIANCVQTWSCSEPPRTLCLRRLHSPIQPSMKAQSTLQTDFRFMQLP